MVRGIVCCTLLVLLVVSAVAPTLSTGRSVARGSTGQHDGSDYEFPALNGLRLPPASPPEFRPRGEGLRQYRNPPPGAIDCTSTPHACWWAGEVWSGSATTSSQIETTIRVPYDAHPAADIVYVLLSAWDNLGSYDQVGIAMYGGTTWTVSTGWSDYCFANPQDDPVASTLAEGQAYVFRMTLGGGFLTFTVLTDYGAMVYTRSHATTATSFFITAIYACGGQIYNSFTNYEEVWKLSSDQPVPSWSFFFYQTKVSGVPSTSWSELKVGNVPSQVVPYRNGADLTIDNHYFMIITDTQQQWFSGSASHLVSAGTVTRLYDPGCFSPYCDVNINVVLATFPPPWSVTITPSAAVPTFRFSLDITFPAGMAPGVYYIRLRADNTPRAQWTTVEMLVVKQRGGGGGGCVAQGTLVLTPTGSVPVESLARGNAILGYDLSSSSNVNLSLLWANRSIENLLFVVNDGLLNVTTTHQPIYVRNSTFTGWLADPQWLGLGDLLFRPSTNTWIVIYKIGFVAQTTVVYDVVPSGVGTFMGSGFGILMLTKRG